MASTVRTTGVINISGTIGANTGVLNGLIGQRKRVKPVDIDLIRQSYELFRQHTHQYFDQQYLAYPNTAPRSSASRTSTTEAVKNAPVDSDTILAGADNYKTFSSQVFELISNFNNYVHVHAHDFEDQVF